MKAYIELSTKLEKVRTCKLNVDYFVLIKPDWYYNLITDAN